MTIASNRRMPLFADAPWSTWPVTVSVPFIAPVVICGEMFALEAALKPSKPSWIAFSIDASSPRYDLRASSGDVTVVLLHAATESTEQSISSLRMVDLRWRRRGVTVTRRVLGDEQHVPRVQPARRFVDAHAQAERFEIGAQLVDRAEAHLWAAVPADAVRDPLDEAGPARAAAPAAIALAHQDASARAQHGAGAREQGALLACVVAV